MSGVKLAVLDWRGVWEEYGWVDSVRDRPRPGIQSPRAHHSLRSMFFISLPPLIPKHFLVIFSRNSPLPKFSLHIFSSSAFLPTIIYVSSKKKRAATHSHNGVMARSEKATKEGIGGRLLNCCKLANFINFLGYENSQIYKIQEIIRKNQVSSIAIR